VTALDRRRLSQALAASAGLGGLASTAQARPPKLTAAEVVGRIQARCAALGVKWASLTNDTFRMGDPQTPVRGVAVTFMATLEILQKAVAQDANFVITHEPMFWTSDDRVRLTDDPLYQAKARFIAEHGLVAWRFHDHWHRLSPDPVMRALLAKLGWEVTRAPYDVRLPARRLADLAEHMTRVLPTRSLRVVGDPDLPVTRARLVGHSLGDVATGLAVADLVVAFEAREFESVEYVRDLVALGRPKALILISHERGEEDGMAALAPWLRETIPGLRIQVISAGDPFRTPRFLDLPRGGRI